MLFIPPLGSSRASGMVLELGIPPQGLAVASEPFCPPRITVQDGALHPHGCCSRDIWPRQGQGVEGGQPRCWGKLLPAEAVPSVPIAPQRQCQHLLGGISPGRA